MNDKNQGPNGASTAGKEGVFETGRLFIIALAHLVHDTYSAFLAPLLPLLIDKLGMSYTLAGSLSVAQRIPSILNPIAGILADRFNARWFVVISPGLTAVAMSLLGIAPHYIFLVILLVIMGVSATLFHVPTPVMIRRLSANKVGRGMSIYMLGGELARALGPITILGAVSLWGLEGSWRLIPFGIMTSVVLHFILDDAPAGKAAHHDNSTAASFRSLGDHRNFFFIITAMTFFRTMLLGSLTFYLPTYLTSKGATMWVAGMSLSIIQSAGAVGTLCCGSISDNLGRKNMLLILSVVTPLFMWAFILYGGVMTVPLLLILGFSLFSYNPVLLAMVQELETDFPAFLNSIYMGMIFLVSSLSVLTVGRLADSIGLDLAYRIAASVGFLTIPFILMLKDDKKKTGTRHPEWSTEDTD